MASTHIELTAGVDTTTCDACGETEARDYVLVNHTGMVLARGTSCGACGPRHRVGRGVRVGDVPVQRGNRAS